MLQTFNFIIFSSSYVINFVLVLYNLQLICDFLTPTKIYKKISGFLYISLSSNIFTLRITFTSTRLCTIHTLLLSLTNGRIDLFLKTMKGERVILERIQVAPLAAEL